MPDHRPQHSKLSPSRLWWLSASLLLLWSLEAQVTASTEPMSGATFQALPANNVQLGEDVLWEGPAISRLECGVMCRDGPLCEAFTFFSFFTFTFTLTSAPESSAGLCWLHQKRHVIVTADPGNGLHPVIPGARTFVLVREWIGGPCSPDSACTQPDSACFSGHCLCSGGLFFDPLLNVCLQSCPRGLGDQFLEYKNMDFDSNDQYSISSGGSIAPCLSQCSADPRCLLFAYVAELAECFFKYHTAQHFPSAWRERSIVTTYQRTCA